MEPMATHDVTRWLAERKPEAGIEYQGETEDGIHVWDLEFDDGPTFRLGVAGQVLDAAGLLAERLMELESAGWLDSAGEEELWVLVGTGDVAGGASAW